MESRNIITFVKVAELRSFSKTAKLLGYSQAAVTVQIKQLEDELDTKLFDRLGKKIRLTASGEKFMPYAVAVIRANEAARTFLHDFDQPCGTIRIGASSSSSAGVLPEILMGFHRNYPDVKFVVKTSDYFENNFENLKQNEIDLALFLDKKMVYEDCITVAEREEELVFITHPENPLAGRENVPLEEIVSAAFITSDRDISYPYYLEQHISETDIEFEPGMEISSISAIVNMLRGGIGASFLPLYMVGDLLEQGVLAKIDTPPLPFKIYSQLIVHKNKWIEPHIRLFMDYAKEYLEGGTEDGAKSDD